ncbi:MULTISPECIES: hypothetical protein [Rhodopseudomonas]|nr:MULTISPECIES: hypothetical protein [Rhodopseudomonas]MDF3810419.1 hypothetical protein [Rhodopseudomonas sp. BAL398]WOK19601.1 hypothetical protein RBJ75_08820 [Rhodopseudomonas sp. BAL398]
MISPRGIGSALLRTATLGVALAGLMQTVLPAMAQAGGSLEERKLPMRFSWIACEPNCRGWIGAVGIVTANTPKDFDDFARGRHLSGAAVVLDSSGGSVNDAITLGRRWRQMGLTTTVGASIETATPIGPQASISPDAYCESMCVFLLLAGNARYVPGQAHVRVHQIWMGDRAEDARASNYTAQDMMIVERDIGRLAKYTFDMGGTGDLLSLALNVPPWEDLHELSAHELRLTNLVTTTTIADLLPPPNAPSTKAVAAADRKPLQERFLSGKADMIGMRLPVRSNAPTQTAEALPSGLAPTVQAQR